MLFGAADSASVRSSVVSAAKCTSRWFWRREFFKRHSLRAAPPLMNSIFLTLRSHGIDALPAGMCEGQGTKLHFHLASLAPFSLLSSLSSPPLLPLLTQPRLQLYRLVSPSGKYWSTTYESLRESEGINISSPLDHQQVLQWFQ